MNRAIIVPSCADEWESELPLFVLDGLLPVDQALSVNTTYLIVSLISMKTASTNPILTQSLLTEMQLRLLLPLLKSPRCCSHETLLASFFCSYRGLLAGLFSTQPAARDEWLAVVQETGMLLERAQTQGRWRKELKHLYNVLSELRVKLRPFGLGIAICTSGVAYALIALSAAKQEEPGPARVPARLPVGVASLSGGGTATRQSLRQDDTNQYLMKQIDTLFQPPSIPEGYQ